MQRRELAAEIYRRTHLRAAGAIVDHAIVVIDREQGARANLSAAQIELRALFAIDEIRASTS